MYCEMFILTVHMLASYPPIWSVTSSSTINFSVIQMPKETYDKVNRTFV